MRRIGMGLKLAPRWVWLLIILGLWLGARIWFSGFGLAEVENLLVALVVVWILVFSFERVLGRGLRWAWARIAQIRG